MIDPRTITIISGGQTGADREALDFAIDNGITYGGWCPRGRLSEDGTIPDRYDVKETPSRKYAERTEWNVRDSDATVAFTIAPRATGGTALTLRLARRMGKPALHLPRGAALDSEETAIAETEAAAKLRLFLEQHDVERLNVAGPRASQEPQVAEFVYRALQIAFGTNAQS